MQYAINDIGIESGGDSADSDREYLDESAPILTPERVSGAQSDANTDVLSESQDSIKAPINNFTGTLKEEFD